MTKPERIPQQLLLDSPRAPATFRRVAEALRKGAIFVYPTETIYGIGGIATILGVKEAIVRAKRRPPENPMILIAPDRGYFAGLPITFPPSAERLAARFWPGALTLVLPSRAEPGGISVRVSPHPFIRALFRYVDKPLYSTSANRGGEPYRNDPDAIFSLFSGDIAFMIDAGPLPPSPPSTVVKVGTDDSVTVLREGAIAGEGVFRFLGSDRSTLGQYH